MTDRPRPRRPRSALVAGPTRSASTCAAASCCEGRGLSRCAPRRGPSCDEPRLGSRRVGRERGGDAARTLHYLTAAGMRARQRFASREAIAYLEAALALALSLPSAAERDQRELEIRMALGRTLADVHGFGAEPVRMNYQRVCELCLTGGTPRDLFEAEYARWYLHAMRGDWR